MPNPFELYTDTDAAKRLPTLPAYAAELAAFLNGDLWRGSAGWIGELPADAEALISMGRGIVSENVLQELLTRHVAAFLGKEPRWALVATTQQTTPQPNDAAPPPLTVPPPIPGRPEPPAADPEITALEEALTAWWDKRGMLATLKDAATHRASVGRGPTVVFIPPGLLDEAGNPPPVATLEDALDLIHVDAREPATAYVYTDPATRLTAGIVQAQEERTRIVELSYRNGPNTVLKVWRNGTASAPLEANLGGYLFVHDTPIAPLMTPQLIQGQKSITLVLSQTMRNVNLAGHRQRDYINAQPPGEWVLSSEGAAGAQRWGDGTWRVFEPGAMLSGPGVTNYIQGNDIYDAQGQKIGVTNPNVSITEPVSVDHFQQTLDMFRYAMHGQAHQLHVFGSDQPLSGISREQARADFETRIAPDAAAADAQGRAVLTAVLGLAAKLLKRPDMFDGLRVDFSCVVNTGPLSTEEQAQIRENVAARLLSEETAMSRLGVDDVLAERARIDEDRMAAQARAPQIGNANGTTQGNPDRGTQLPDTNRSGNNQPSNG